jgi:hypothetical protein
MNRAPRRLELHSSGGLLALALAQSLLSGCGSADSTRAARREPMQPVDVSTEVNLCPSFAYAMILPQALRLDEEASVVAFATDPDSGDAELTYAWSATSGDFDEPWNAWAQYRCSASGLQVLSVTTSDPDGCEKRLDFDVTCADK